MGIRNFTSTILPLAWSYAALRTVAPPGGWGFRAFGYCASCDRRSMFVLAKRHAAWVIQLAAQWDHGDAYKQALATRESNICALCRANVRMRAQARAVLDVLRLHRTSDLVARFSHDPQFMIFEAATNTVFRSATVLRAPNYISSEYRESAPSGALVDGILNEDLQALSFSDASIDNTLPTSTAQSTRFHAY